MSLENLGLELEAAIASKEAAQADWIAQFLKIDSANPAAYDDARDAIQTLEDKLFLAEVARVRYVVARDNKEYVEPVRYVVSKPSDNQLSWRRKRAEIASSMKQAIEDLPGSIDLLAKLLKEDERFIDALTQTIDAIKYDALYLTMYPQEGYI